VADFSEPNEFHMGASDWKLSLFEDNFETTKSHPALSEPNSSLRFLLPASFQPWSPDGHWLTLATWKEQHFHYSISQQQMIKSDISGLVDALLWSPSTARYILSIYNYVPTRSRSCFIAGIGLNTPIQLSIACLADEPAHFWWLKDGTNFIGLYRSSKEAHPIIELFDSNSGHSKGIVSADPNQFVAYEESRYRNISRDHYTLEISPSTWCVGYFLDMWHTCYFDPETNQLSLAVYRPAGEPKMNRMQTVLPVKDRWCKLQLLL
jgi:hypothetical protein